MTREQAINYLKSSGMSEEQINGVASAFTCQEIYNQGWKDGAEATAYHVELCEKENPTIPLSVIEDIKAEIDRQYKWLMQTDHTLCDIDIAFSAIKRIVEGRTECE